jgi:hypothetical protein
VNTIAFASLLKDPVTHARDEFLYRYTTAALVVEEVADRPPNEFDGRTPFVLPEWWRPTPEHVGRKRGGLHPVHRFGSVVWLEKTRRNPFANLITIGRAPNNDIRYPLESLSKLHATLCRSGTRWHVQDHSSRNGTFVNDEPLPPGKIQELQDGDQLRFCPELKARFFSAAALFDFLGLVGRMAPREV